MSISIKDNAEITKSVFNSTTVESSSDLIEVLYELFKRVSPLKVCNLSPVREIEKDNWRLGISNEAHIKKLLSELEAADLVDAEEAYRYVVEEFLENETISKIFKLDDNDLIGWGILRELNTKRDYCKRLIAIAHTVKETS